MANFVNFTNFDGQNKKGRSGNIPMLDAAGSSEVQSLTDALQNITVGTNIASTIVEQTVVDAGDAVGPATDKAARRGNKWLFRYQIAGEDSIRTATVPCADNEDLPAPPNDFLDLTAGDGLAVKTAFEACAGSVAAAATLASVQQVNYAD